jgi:hypothetical protein
MSAPSCPSPLDWDTLLAYWLGELDPEDEARVEEHYLGCAGCSRRLAQQAALAQGVRKLVRQSGVSMVINEPFVHRLAGDGLRVREYRVPRNGSVNCTVAPDDDIVVARLEAPLHEVRRVDLVTVGDGDSGAMRQEDIPFLAGSGEVIFSPGIGLLRALPATTLRMRLLAVDDDSERTLGEYTFHHTPWPPGK